MKLSEIGEREIIKIFEREAKNKIIGDDAAVLKFKNKNLVFSCDSIYQRTHLPEIMKPEQIGRFAVNVAMSDIAAMGAEPRAMLFSFGFPRETEISYVQKIAKAIVGECRKYNALFIGGDTKESKELCISSFAFGIADKPLLRSGAREGDIICLTNKIGDAFAGFYVIEKKLKIKNAWKLVKKAIEPEARVKEGLIIAKYASSCTDISDSLAFSLHEIANASKKGFEIYEEKLPFSQEFEALCKKENIDLRETLLYKSGGEYELLFTVSREKIEKLKEETEKKGIKISEIGIVKKRGKFILTKDRKRERVKNFGYEAFKTKTCQSSADQLLG